MTAVSHPYYRPPRSSLSTYVVYTRITKIYLQADILLLVLAIFLPPLVAFLKRGCGSQLLLNILLDFLWWVPGVIHAWYLVIATPGSRH
jgi:uncharacterized membrane protein YqaE (UPF0057 family)